MESGKIPDSAITASSEYESDYLATYAGRLNYAKDGCAWTTKWDKKENAWLQVDLGKIMLVASVATQGRCSYGHWTTSYLFSYGNDGQTWKFVE